MYNIGHTYTLCVGLVCKNSASVMDSESAQYVNCEEITICTLIFPTVSARKLLVKQRKESLISFIYNMHVVIVSLEGVVSCNNIMAYWRYETKHYSFVNSLVDQLSPYTSVILYNCTSLADHKTNCLT